MYIWKIIYKFMVVLLIVLLGIGTASIFSPPIKSIRKYHQRRLELQEENRQLEEQIRDLAEKQARFKSDPAFVERTARENGMVKSNEVVYKLESETGE